MNCSEPHELKDKFDTQGYVVVRGLIDSPSIEKCLFSLERFKRKNSYYFSQSNHIWEKSNKLTNNGFLSESIQSPSKLFLFPSLQKSVIEIISSEKISNVLSVLTGFEYFIRWQDMLFDKSTGTIDHADEWYLDTYPAGTLVGIWIALEDINEKAGRFFVVPKTQKYSLPKYNETQDQAKYIKLVQDSIRDSGLKRHAPALMKGDVLFWSAQTIHGAYSQLDEQYSRKSITAHYHPVGYARDKARTPEDIKNYMNRMQPTKNKKIYLDNHDPSINFFKLSFLKFLIKSGLNLYNPKKVEMARDKHIST